MCCACWASAARPPARRRCSPRAASAPAAAAPPPTNGAAEVTGGFDWRKAGGHRDLGAADAAPLPGGVPAAARRVHRAHRHHGEGRPGGRGRLLHPPQHRARQRRRQLRRVHDRRLLHLDLRASRVDGGPEAVAARTRSATNPDYDFEDIYEGLRRSTSWDFQVGSPLGTGGQWAIPWGFETNVIAYNKAEFDRRGIQPAETFDDLIQLATDLTDRANNTLRHRVPRLPVVGHHPPRLHDPVRPRGLQGLQLQGEELTAGDELARGRGLHAEVGRAGHARQARPRGPTTSTPTAPATWALAPR